MSAQHLPKFTRFYIPLWRRPIPPYPLWYKGNPQLKIYMPLFWMKLVKSPDNVPNCFQKFEVHPQMTQYDVKNYLEKIYDVRVNSVRTELIKGEARTDFYDYNKDIDPYPASRFAHVTVAEGEAFEFPDLFAVNTPEHEEASKDYDTLTADFNNKRHETWNKEDVPDFFR